MIHKFNEIVFSLNSCLINPNYGISKVSFAFFSSFFRNFTISKGWSASFFGFFKLVTKNELTFMGLMLLKRAINQLSLTLLAISIYFKHICYTFLKINPLKGISAAARSFNQWFDLSKACLVWSLYRT